LKVTANTISVRIKPAHPPPKHPSTSNRQGALVWPGCVACPGCVTCSVWTTWAVWRGCPQFGQAVADAS